MKGLRRAQQFGRAPRGAHRRGSFGKGGRIGGAGVDRAIDRFLGAMGIAAMRQGQRPGQPFADRIGIGRADQMEPPGPPHQRRGIGDQRPLAKGDRPGGDPRRAEAVNKPVPRTPDGNPDRARIEAALDPMKAQLAKLDQAVAATGHLAGSAFTLADAYLVPILFYMDQLPESRRMLGGCAQLKAYLERHLQRPSVKTTIPPPMQSLRAAS